MIRPKFYSARGHRSPLRVPILQSLAVRAPVFEYKNAWRVIFPFIDRGMMERETMTDSSMNAAIFSNGPSATGSATSAASSSPARISGAFWT
jgi:hypothetical protein